MRIGGSSAFRVPAPDGATQTITAADGVTIAFGVASPNLGDGVEVVAGDIVPVLGDQAMEISGGEVVIDYARVPIDLTAHSSVTNPNGMTYSVTHISGTTYELSITGDGSIRDGISEAVALYFPIVDAAGNAVNITQGKWRLRSRMTLVSATVGSSALFMWGIKTVPGTESSGTVRAAGITTAASGAIEASGCTALASNSTQAAAGLAAIDFSLDPLENASGSWEIGDTLVNRFDAVGAKINAAQLQSSSDAAPGTPAWCMILGSDALSITTAKTVRVQVEAIATQVIP